MAAAVAVAVVGAALAAYVLTRHTPQHEGEPPPGPAATLIRIDPGGGSIELRASLPFSDLPTLTSSVPMAAGEGGIWIASGSTATLLHADPTSGHIVAEVTEQVSVVGIAIGAQRMWVANGGPTNLLIATVARVDPATDEVAHLIRVPDPDNTVFLFDATFGAGAVWVDDSNGGKVFRLDPATDAVTDVIPIGGSAANMAFGEGAL